MCHSPSLSDSEIERPYNERSKSETAAVMMPAALAAVSFSDKNMIDKAMVTRKLRLRRVEDTPASP